MSAKKVFYTLFTALLLSLSLPLKAQKKQVVPASRKDLYDLLDDAGLRLTLPYGFKEIPPLNNEDFSFDYAMQLPGKGFEMWVQVKSQKQNWVSYENAKNDKKTELANPDSMYLDLGRANAIALSGNKNCTARNLPPDVLARYNADAGKSYLLDLLNMQVTHHYRYALLISLQKNHTGTLIAIYFTNQKDADFYKYVNRAGYSFRFRPPAAG